MDYVDYLVELSIALWTYFFLKQPVLALARCGILRKSGEPWQKGLVPFYGEYLQYRHTWSTDWYWFQLFSMGGRFWCLALFVVSVAEEIGYYSHAQLVGMFFLSLPSVAMALMGLCMRYRAMEKLAAAYGRGRGFAAGLFFLNPIFMLILGFGRSEYR